MENFKNSNLKIRPLWTNFKEEGKDMFITTTRDNIGNMELTDIANQLYADGYLKYDTGILDSDDNKVYIKIPLSEVIGITYNTSNEVSFIVRLFGTPTLFYASKENDKYMISSEMISYVGKKNDKILDVCMGYNKSVEHLETEHDSDFSIISAYLLAQEQ
jgi:hypothetical protein